eukprot:jgi/Tetstr1/439920/TSEL_028327.t1
MQHKNIMRLHEFYMTRTKLYLVMELMRGGSLLDLILERGGLKEGDAKLVFRQVFWALHYMHERNVIHRDIKLENVMLGQLNDLESVKIADFGFAIEVATPEARDKITALAGTPVYLAPEAVETMLGHKTVPSVMTPALDLWAAGVALYMLIGGFPPFEGKSSKEIFRSIYRCIISYKAPSWRNVSDDCVAMINALLTRDPANRITAEEALTHKWSQQRVTAQDLSKTFAVSAVNAASAPAEADFDPNKPPVASANLNESIHIKQSALLEIQERHEAGGGMDHSLMRIFGENKLKVKSFRKKDSALGAPVFIASKSLGRTNSGVAKLATLMENVGPARFDDNGNIPQHPATHQPHSPPAYDTDSSEYSSSEEGEEDNDDGRSHGQPASPSEQPSAASSRHVSQFEAAGQPRMYGAAAAFAPKSKGGKQYAEPAGDKVRDGLQSPATLPGAVEDNSEGEAGP